MLVSALGVVLVNLVGMLIRTLVLRMRRRRLSKEEE
jgi:hypothetical protein